MRSNKYLWNICMSIYRQSYLEVEPSADFDVLVETKVVSKPNWFMDYYLPEDRMIEIVDEWCKKHRCSKHERDVINNEVWLGCSPTSVKKK